MRDLKRNSDTHAAPQLREENKTEMASILKARIFKDFSKLGLLIDKS